MCWIEQATVVSEMLVSVVMSTRDRASIVLNAIASVQAQSYPNWELIVVDNGSDDNTSEVLGSVDDARIRCLRVDDRGSPVAAGRNRALAEAKGQVVTYLDDDNLMHPHWLRSLVWAFSRWPDVDTAYGARIVEDTRPFREVPHEMPLVQLEPFDRGRLETEMSFIDINVFAHRDGLSGGRFDESFTACADWDLFLRLTADKPALTLPVVAVLYSTSAPNRLIDTPAFWEEVSRIHNRS
jgi:glycosyltransferase involved in cell wall biosynthesis